MTTPRPAAPPEPEVRTEAGKRLLGLDMTPEEGYWVNLGANEMRAAILAIEAEAAAEAAQREDRLRAAAEAALEHGCMARHRIDLCPIMAQLRAALGDA